MKADEIRSGGKQFLDTVKDSITSKTSAASAMATMNVLSATMLVEIAAQLAEANDLKRQELHELTQSKTSGMLL